MRKVATGRVLITGASSGIGREFALQLYALGWNLVLVSRNKNRLEQLRAELLGGASGVRSSKQSVELLIADLSLPNAAKAVHRECRERALSIDFLINNAGAGIFGRHVDLTPTAVDSMIALNIAALTGLCGLFGADMKLRGSGRILNIGSLAGRQATPYFAAYAATKSYVLSFSLALRAELAPFGVTVTCLEPGYVETAFDTNAGITIKRYLEFSRRSAMQAEKVARIGLLAAFSGKGHLIAGFRNKATNAVFRLVPLTWPPAIIKNVLDRLLR